MVDVFNVQIFFIVFRESLEAIIVVSVLLAFIKQGIGSSGSQKDLYKRLVKQVWLGAILGVVLCLIIGVIFIAVYYTLQNDLWSVSEDLWEGIFCLIATILISIMGIALLRINKMQEKWRIKIARSILANDDELNGETNVTHSRFHNFTKWFTLKHYQGSGKFSHWLKKYALFILPFITCLREGLEAVVFVGGVGIGTPASSFPIPVICGIIAGITVGFFIYLGGARVSLQIFLCISTCILYLLAAGLFSRAIWDFETFVFNKQTGGDASENGSGPGTYNIHKSVWHVNCCNPETDNGWDVFNALLGWQNSATYGSVISYNVYWIAVIFTLFLMFFEEKRGHLPFAKNLTLRQLNPMHLIRGSKKTENELSEAEQKELFQKVQLQLAKETTESN